MPKAKLTPGKESQLDSGWYWRLSSFLHEKLV
jgi:hypothetical protein